MNKITSQLLLNDNVPAGLFVRGYPLTPPANVSIEEFERETKRESNFCKWKKHTDHQGYSIYNTDCFHSFDLDNSTDERDFIFCPYCGKKIILIEHPSDSARGQR